jgi:hypothetical protein
VTLGVGARSGEEVRVGSQGAVAPVASWGLAAAAAREKIP